MSDEKFTLGPWEVCDAEHEADLFSVWAVYKGRLICDGVDKNEANLIAAAPDLYDALDNLLASLESGPSPSPAEDAGWEALAKARGEKR